MVNWIIRVIICYFRVSLFFWIVFFIEFLMIVIFFVVFFCLKLREDRVFFVFVVIVFLVLLKFLVMRFWRLFIFFNNFFSKFLFDNWFFVVVFFGSNIIFKVDKVVRNIFFVEKVDFIIVFCFIFIVFCIEMYDFDEGILFLCVFC